MPNKRYLAGRNFEYEVMKTLSKLGYKCIRAAGSHGEFDVIAYKPSEEPKFVQCKIVSSLALAKALAKRFKKNTIPTKYYDQIMAIKVKGEQRIRTVTV